MIHIKRDGNWMCGASKGINVKKHYWYKSHSHISFKDAHTANLNSKYACTDCVKRYYLILSKLKNPIIIEE